MDRFIAKLDELEIDFELRSNKTVIQGDSSTGKTYVYELLHSEYKGSDVFFINYYDIETPINAKMMCDALKEMKNKFIIIDQANDVFEVCSELEDIVDEDKNNQYILMGRTLKMHYNISDMAELKIVNNKATLTYLFPLPL